MKWADPIPLNFRNPLKYKLLNCVFNYIKLSIGTLNKRNLCEELLVKFGGKNFCRTFSRPCNYTLHSVRRRQIEAAKFSKKKNVFPSRRPISNQLLVSKLPRRSETEQIEDEESGEHSNLPTISKKSIFLLVETFGWQLKIARCSQPEILRSDNSQPAHL